MEFVRDRGTATLVGCRSKETVLRVPDTWRGLPVTRIGPGAFRGAGCVERVILPETVTEIGPGAFRDCWELRSVLSPGVTAPGLHLQNRVLILRREAFLGTALESVCLEGEYLCLEERAFAYCRELTQVQFPNCRFLRVAEAAFPQGFSDCPVQGGICRRERTEAKGLPLELLAAAAEITGVF